MSIRYWLLKSEPGEFSIDDLAVAGRQSVRWFGVRNYQARNFMRDDMKVGDRGFFYHSSCPEPGIVGILEVSAAAAPDRTQFDPHSRYHDPKATLAAPRWFAVEVRLVEKTRPVSLSAMRAVPALAGMKLLQRGSRLSITPVEPAEWSAIVALAGRKS